jgi:hypothetical protein
MKSARRSFMKGSVAAPLVLTVGPAAARARASNIACINRDADRAATASPRPAAVAMVDADDWLRTRIELVELNVWGEHSSKPLPGKYFLGADRRTYWKLDESSVTPTATPTSYTTSNCSARRTGERRHALVYVDPRGHTRGYAFETNGGTPVTGSCWTSVAVFRA